MHHEESAAGAGRTDERHDDISGHEQGGVGGYRRHRRRRRDRHRDAAHPHHPFGANAIGDREHRPAEQHHRVSRLGGVGGRGRLDPAGMVGRWEGDASTGDGSGFTISLDISQQCTLGQVCGSIGVSQVPCYGRVSLEGVDGDDAEFRVSDFDQRSNTASCQAGAGEHFRLLSDGRLSYHTTYEPVAQGILTRQSRSRTHTKRGNAQPRQGL